MPRLILLIFLSITLVNQSFAQNVDLNSFLKAWSVTGKNQTLKAEETYSNLKKSRDTVYFQQTLKDLYSYLKNNPDDRLWVRTVMYDVYGQLELGISHRNEYPKHAARILDCIKLANKLHDEQLKAELYALYAEVTSNPSNYTLYNLKAIELQQKIGIANFRYVANRYYNVAFGLFLNEDYRQSINYGLKFLSLKDNEVKDVDPFLFILINDVVGSSYYELDLLDSTRYYYQKIIDRLLKEPHQDKEIQQLWLSIAKGSIGKTLNQQNRTNEALPLINEYLNTSLALRYYSNAASAENILASIYMDRQQYKKAEIAFKNAYRYAKVDNALKQKSLACKGLSDLFTIKKNSDSVLAYFALHQIYRDSLVTKINGGKLDALNASIAFDNMESNLQNANNSIKDYKSTRNLILAGIVCLAVIALLFYNRKMLQQKNSGRKFNASTKNVSTRG